MTNAAPRIAITLSATLVALSCAREPMWPSLGPPPTPATITRVETAAPAEETHVVQVCPPLDAEPPTSERSEIEGAVPPIVDATGRVMAPFYERLARLSRGRAKDHVRIAVYGDSNMTMDFITGEMRRVLQAKYGDAGHGFIALGRPWSHYRHMDVTQRVHSGFTSYAVSTHPIGDGGYGHSGIAAESRLRGAITEVATAGDASPIGRAASRFDVFFLRKPKYGSFDVRVDGTVVRTIDCAAPDVSLGFLHTEIPDGPHRIEFVVGGNGGLVRMLGAALERDAPSLIIDSLGVGAMNTRSMARELPAINVPMLRQRKYDLVVFMTGANDVFERPQVPMWLKRVIDVHREALPNVPILLVSPPDRGKFKSFEPTVAVAVQRRELAAEFQTAFWDLWSAMGGRGSMAHFRRRNLAASDYIHFNAKGGAWVGDRLVFALFRDFKAYLAEHPGAGCDGDPSSETSNSTIAAAQRSP